MISKSVYFKSRTIFVPLIFVLLLEWSNDYEKRANIFSHGIKRAKELQYSNLSSFSNLSNFAELVQFFHVFVNLVKFLTESKNTICIKSIYFYVRRKIH